MPGVQEMKVDNERPYIFHHKHGTLTVFAQGPRLAFKKAIREARGLWLMTPEQLKEYRDI